MLRFAPMAKRLLAVLVFLVCAGFVSWFALVQTVHRGTLAVPNLGEETLEEARQELHDLGLELEVDEPGVFSASIDPGPSPTRSRPRAFTSRRDRTSKSGSASAVSGSRSPTFAEAR